MWPVHVRNQENRFVSRQRKDRYFRETLGH